MHHRCTEIAAHAIPILSSLPSIDDCNTTPTAALAAIKAMVSALESISNCNQCYVHLEYRTKTREICYLIVERFASLYEEVSDLKYNWALQQEEDFQLSNPVSEDLRGQKMVMGDYEPDTEQVTVGVLAFLLRFQINRFFKIIRPIEKKLKQYPDHDSVEWRELTWDAYGCAQCLEQIYDRMTGNAIEPT